MKQLVSCLKMLDDVELGSFDAVADLPNMS
jgi:hypothetical protein